MMHAKLSTMVQVVRLRYAVLFVLLLTVVYWTGIHPWMTNWGSTEAEQQMALPGDDLSPTGAARTTWAITVNAPPAAIWPWLVQVGQDRAGFYSYTWLENLVGADIHNADEIHPEWQRLAVGDAWRLAPADYLWGLGKDAVVPVVRIEPGRVLVLKSLWGAHVILPLDERRSRLIVRGQAGASDPVTKLILDPLVFTMEKRMLLGLQARAEGRPDALPALKTVAQLGWAAAALVVAGLFLSQRRRRPWLALPVVAALPALVTSQDLEAGLAAFLAVGMTVLGFLIFGRRWWGLLLVIGAVVMLTLLLAPDAFIAIGLAFALLLLAALSATVVGRASTSSRVPGRLATPTQ
ncbi:MAG: hypothetical protein KIT87_28335 [Anaerolineae bacterium]|nr:hypothetical protein [Anaerolineae bacterium]